MKKGKLKKMSKSVYNKNAKVDFTKQPMFFGEDNGVQRYDTFKYPVFDKLTEHQLGLFWRPQEVSLPCIFTFLLITRNRRLYINMGLYGIYSF